MLGDFLEKLFGPEDPFRTVRATIRFRTAPKPKEKTFSVWLGVPSRWRVESPAGAVGEESQLIVVNGERSWERDSQGHVVVSESERRGPALTEVERHFCLGFLREILPPLILKETGQIQTAGRHCVCLVARLRPGDRLWPHWLPSPADEYELHADPERAVLLAIISRRKGEVFEEQVVSEVAFDETLDDGLFTYTPEVGAQVAPRLPVSEVVSLQSALTRVSFTVLIPTHLPDPDHTTLQVHYDPPRGPGGSGRRSLTLMYFNFETGSSFFISESDTPDPDQGGNTGEEVVVDSRRFRISMWDGGTTSIAFEQDGTHVNIHGELDRAGLLAIATSLRPIKAEDLPPGPSAV